MCAGDGRELLQAVELALERTVFLERTAMNDLHGAQFTEDGAGQPDFAVAAMPDGPQQFVVGDGRRLRVEG